MIPETRYARSGEFNIAYQLFGESELDLVFVPGLFSHLGIFWEEPGHARFFRRLGSFARVIAFDKRGTGMSDRAPRDMIPTLEERMDDVRAVMDAAGSERAAVFGISEGGAMCALFAATFPERTRALVIYGTGARSKDAPDYPWGPATEWWDQTASVVEEQWGKRELTVELVRFLAPSMVGDEAWMEWAHRYFTIAASPGAAAALMRMNAQTDIRAVVPSIRRSSSTARAIGSGARATSPNGSQARASSSCRATTTYRSSVTKTRSSTR